MQWSSRHTPLATIGERSPEGQTGGDYVVGQQFPEAGLSAANPGVALAVQLGHRLNERHFKFASGLLE